MQFKGVIKGIIPLTGAIVAVVCLSGCMSVEKAERGTEAVWSNKVSVAWAAVSGATNAYDFASPAEQLRLRLGILAETQGLHQVAAQLQNWRVLQSEPLFTNGAIRLSLKDALRLGAKNDRKYQDHKQAVYRAALNFDTEGHDFDTTFNGFLLGAVRGDMEAERLTGGGGAGLSRTFENGASLSANLALNVAQLLQNDFRSAGLVGDVSATIPLLRGSGREIVLEPLIQAERTLLYAIRDFEYYRQSYAVDVTSAYFNVLSLRQKIMNAESKENNLLNNRRRANRLRESGRMSVVEFDQAEQSFLNAVQSTILVKQSYAAAVDKFAILIGLPPASPIELDSAELVRMREVMQAVDAGGEAMVAVRYPKPQKAVAMALTNRLDLMNTFARINDAERALKVAADALGPDLTLKAGASSDRSVNSDASGLVKGADAWSAQIRSDLPWERRRERNAYRVAMLALEKARRNYEEGADAVRLTVRNDLRSIEASRQTYLIQKRAVEVALRRRESMQMFQQAGRAQMRDLLDAEDALLTAQNAFLTAVVDWRLMELTLRKDMGILRMEQDGLWTDFEGGRK